MNMNDIKNQILISIKKYYIALLLFIFSTVVMMITIKTNFNGVVADNIIRLLLTSIYGAIIALVIRSIIDRASNKKLYNLFYLLIPILMAIVYFVILNNLNTVFPILKYMTLCLLSSILFVVIPFLGREEDSDYYSYKVIISLIITGFCYFLLIFGIVMIIQSVSILFGITIKDYIYMEIAIFILGFIMPTLFLSQIPTLELERKEYPDFIKKILMYIIFPILSIYTIVLYAYFIKILVELKWPSNMLGNLVIFYSLISIVILYFVNKMRTNKWINNFIKIYPYTLIIPMIMMLISILIRINYYGFTEARYYALMCFVFVMISIYIIKVKNKVKYIPLTLSILLFISTFGPLSAMNISKLNQEKRLEKILINNNMLEDNKIIKNTNLGEEEKKKIFNILEYFQENHGLNDIDFLPKNFDMNNMQETFGFSINDI
jgi:hypothetical protein